jgi:type II secretory pathway pseudopilin PulG
MRVWSILVPLVGICVALAQPLARYASQQRDEAAAVRALRQIQEAQERFKAAVGSYATDAATLVASCPDADAALPATVFAALERAGYLVQLRTARGATVTGHDCHGRPTATDYYLAAAPQAAWEAADKAFAGRADGQLFIFVDGVPPHESDMASGLPIKIDEVETFKIP